MQNKCMQRSRFSRYRGSVVRAEAERGQAWSGQRRAPLRHGLAPILPVHPMPLSGTALRLWRSTCANIPAGANHTPLSHYMTRSVMAPLFGLPGLFGVPEALSVAVPEAWLSACRRDCVPAEDGRLRPRGSQPDVESREMSGTLRSRNLCCLESAEALV